MRHHNWRDNFPSMFSVLFWCLDRPRKGTNTRPRGGSLVFMQQTGIESDWMVRESHYNSAFRVFATLVLSEVFFFLDFIGTFCPEDVRFII